jgi:hypothetical protein
MAELGEQIAGIPQQFKENYEANIAKPLIEMRDKVAETADQAKRVEDHLAGAAENMKKMGFDETGLNAPLPTLPPVEAPRIPTQEELSSSPSGGGGGGGGRGAGGNTPQPKERQLTNRERALLAGFESRAGQLEERGFFEAANKIREKGQAKLETRRKHEANLEIQKEMGLPGAASRSLENLAEAAGATRLKPEEFQEKMDEIEKDIERRAKGEDGTEAPGGGGGAGGAGAKAEPEKSTLETLVEQIKDLVTLIEPKLPVAVLTT